MTNVVGFGARTSPKSLQAFHLRAGTVGLGGVLRTKAGLRVVGKAWLWPLLSHELVKATVELICLHGINQWDDDTYQKVMTKADRLEYEPWMLQTGPELWRRLLAVLPTDRTVAEMIMPIARMPAKPLEDLMFAVGEDPTHARAMLARLKQSQHE